MKTFELKDFQARFGALMAVVRNRMSELDLAADELHRAVSAFTARAI